ncbi:Protein of unknown function DUF165 [Moorella glycerini]|uniref:Probable queuosine precursor transporter n=1 Tax=Neomoorella stamsii TaxID=1266720 RepID=A0A9X7J062_9FIRM|nr:MULTISPECIES: queuosine precursor transporter [Moorella]PRR68945.1 hypothetical protein MOST_32270 [Moorella stamsii]CEP67566.1 Protein of unknown function DUF165 [Moorella glycerini]
MRYKLFPFVMVAFVVVLLLSNTVAVKVAKFGPFFFDGAVILFPISYIFGDILTEVYGYKRSRVVVWTGFIACLFMSFVYWLVGILPAAPPWGGQEAYQRILGQTPRIVLASLVAFFCGEFTNSYILAKLKIFTRGRWLWTRTIGSTIAGQLVDTALFITIAFAGIMPGTVLLRMIMTNYLFKTTYEVLATPLTYAVTGWLKRVENEDYYDFQTNYNPFRVTMEDLR